jgi:hypothetical protein
MGMYTELIFGATLKKETPVKVLNTLFLLMGHDNHNPEEETEQKITDGRNVFRFSSYYFGVSNCHSNMWLDGIQNQWIVSSRANLKNYEDEIETFLDWIKPWIEQGSGRRDFYAIVTYEEQDEPTIYYLREED